MNLLRPHQVREDLNIRQELEAKLSNPHIQDKGEVRGQLDRLKKRLDTQTPQPIPEGERDTVVKRCEELKQEFTQGMLSHEEMRKCPPGAIDAHLQWERKNKAKIIEWKNNMLRLNHDSDERDLVNIEKFRPKTNRLNLDNAQIPGKQFYIPDTVGMAYVISDEELRILKERAPEIARKLPTMDPEGRRLAVEIYVYDDQLKEDVEEKLG